MGRGIVIGKGEKMIIKGHEETSGGDQCVHNLAYNNGFIYTFVETYCIV